MNRFHADYSLRGLDIIAISNEDRAKVERFVKDQSVSYPVFLDPTGKAFSDFGVRGIPASFLVDEKDQVIWEGHPGDPGLHELIDEHL